MTALTVIMPACTLITLVLVWMAVREAISTLREPDVTREEWLPETDTRRG